MKKLLITTLSLTFGLIVSCNKGNEHSKQLENAQIDTLKMHIERNDLLLELSQSMFLEYTDYLKEDRSNYRLFKGKKILKRTKEIDSIVTSSKYSYIWRTLKNEDGNIVEVYLADQRLGLAWTLEFDSLLVEIQK